MDNVKGGHSLWVRIVIGQSFATPSEYDMGYILIRHKLPL